MANETLSRRGFIELALVAVAALPRQAETAPRLPHRLLGRTGVQVPILGFGCGTRFLGYPEEDAVSVLNRAIDSGITYLDTAASYGSGVSETRVGAVMATRRREVFLATKIPARARSRDLALEALEASLRRLRTDHVDLVHLHGLGDDDDLARIEARDGALQALYELREQKLARFVGMTSHSDGAVMAKAIERHDLDCVQLAMNPARASRFEELALPAAQRKNLGVIVMKVTAQDRLLGDTPGLADVAELFAYAWSLPISTVVAGMPKLEHIDGNAAAARAFVPLPPAEMERLRERLAGRRTALEGFFASHRDGMPA